MRTIPLSKGLHALVDDADYARVAAFKWYALRRNNCWHAARTFKRAGIRRTIYVHRFILDAPDGLEVDHENGEGLDNQRHNIRVATHRQNAQNRRMLHVRKSSQFHGVSYDGRYGRGRRWRTVIHAGPANARGQAKQIHLGHFPTEEDAARAFDRAAIEHFGAFAVTNFPREEYAA